ncbi:MAG: permease [Anaerolineales bacterium]|jgi:uncharacterized membrane protein YraQ (UPF0718 family)
MRDKTPLYLLLVLFFLMILTVVQMGWHAVLEGIVSGGKILLQVTPLLVAAFLVAGMTQVLVTKEFVTKWLGSQTGWKGIGLACLAGALIPGGPYVYYPIAAVMLQNGAGLGVLVSFISAKNLWSVSRLPYEIALIGFDFTIARFFITLIFPPLLGFLVDILFGKFLETIRTKAPQI